MPDSQDPKQVTNNDLPNSQFGGGLINAESVKTERIGGDIYNNCLVQQQVTSDNSSSSLQQKERSPTVSRSPLQQDKLSEQVLENPVGEKIFEDHKYKGKLATLEIELYEIIPSKKLSIKLSISFGTIEVKIPNTNKTLNRTNKTIDIKFGIRNSELYFHLENGIMPLKERNLIINRDYNWKGNPTGTKDSPIWEFKLDSESRNGNQSQILYGLLKNEVIGVLELLKADISCELKAVLKVSVNRNYIAIIDLDDGLNKKNRETKIGLLLQYLKAEIEHYISQVAIKV